MKTWYAYVCVYIYLYAFAADGDNEICLNTHCYNTHCYALTGLKHFIQRPQLISYYKHILLFSNWSPIPIHIPMFKLRQMFKK